MIADKIEKLIPYIEENFITFPLWEEGKYIPFVSIWQKINSISEVLDFDKKLDQLFLNSKYDYDCLDNNFSETIYKYHIFPRYKELDNGGFEYLYDNWSIEEILDLLYSVLVK